MAIGSTIHPAETPAQMPGETVRTPPARWRPGSHCMAYLPQPLFQSCLSSLPDLA